MANEECQPKDLCKGARQISSEAAFLAEYLQERVNDETLEPQFNALIALIDKSHEYANQAELNLDE